MAHGISTTGTADSFTGNNVGATFVFPVATDPDFPIRAHVISVCTITGTVAAGTLLSYDVKLKDGTFIDSGQPALPINGATTTVFRYDAIMSTGTIIGFRTRVAGWTTGTSASVVTTVVYLV